MISRSGMVIEVLVKRARYIPRYLDFFSRSEDVPGSGDTFGSDENSDIGFSEDIAYTGRHEILREMGEFNDRKIGGTTVTENLARQKAWAAPKEGMTHPVKVVMTQAVACYRSQITL